MTDIKDEDQVNLLMDEQIKEKEIKYEKEIIYENSSQEEINNDEQTQFDSNPHLQKQEEEKPLDLWQMIIQGNFDIILTNENLMDINEIGPQGFGLVHYLTTYNRLEGLQLIKRRGANLDLLSNGKQTALSIAAHYGFIEITKFLIDSGCQVNTVNSVGMTPLQYAVKNKRYPIIFYFLTKSPNLQLQDNQGCSLLHLSAQENDVFMMRFYKAVQVEFDLFDKSGSTPLSKAINQCSISVIKYMLRHNPDLINYDMDANIIKTSPMIQKLISQAALYLKIKSNDNLEKLIQLVQKLQKYILLTVFVTFILIELIFFIISDVQRTLNDSFGGLLLDITFIIGLLYSVFFIVWFMLKTTDNQNQGTKILQRKMEQYQNLQNQQNQTEIVVQKQQPKEETQKKKKAIRKQEKSTEQELMPQVLNIQNEEEQQLNEGEEEDNEQQDEEMNDKEKFIHNVKKQTQQGLYEMERTPSFLEGITLKDFLGLNYKPVEDFIDTMKNKPAYYFKFATRIGQFKEEINALLEINDPLWYNGFTIIHIVYFLFETNRFRLIHRINWDRICFTCLSYKLPRTYHCVSCNQCIKDYHFHSKLLGKCINSTNHLFFLILIFSFTVLINFNLIFTFYHYYDQVKSIFVFIPNIYFLIAKDSTMQALIYAFNLLLAYLLNYQLIVEIVCILYNITFNELFNSNRYKYLYHMIQAKNGSYYMTLSKRLKPGVTVNCFSFIKNSFRNLKLL